MDKTITVKGCGKINVAPDYAQFSVTLSASDKSYDKALSNAAIMLEQLKSAAAQASFIPSDLKTASFNVNTEYESRRDTNGSYVQVFKGFLCTHSLRISFDLDLERISKLFAAISQCEAVPQFSIQFTVKDKQSLKDEMLKNAAADAMHKADILAAASGVKCGALISVDYNFNDVKLYSPTMMRTMNMAADASDSIKLDITPENVSAEEAVTFVWELVG